MVRKGHGGKFYAVRKGYQVEIFTTWAEYEIQVKGYPGCEFWSFKLYEDVVRYLGFSP
jgi:viroplasmin and RNaseH domain-containing protein